MHAFIVYAHPCHDSFTRLVLDSFISGLKAGDHTYTISDLYRMDFKTDLSESEYLREAYYLADSPLSPDVIIEQEKINTCDAIVFIYPVFWTEAPAKLVGWFDRVFSYGFAYGDRTMKILKKALVLCTAGHSLEHLMKTGQYESMKTVMLGDRIFDRADSKKMIVLDGTSRADPELRNANCYRHLSTSFEAGKSL